MWRASSPRKWRWGDFRRCCIASLRRAGSPKPGWALGLYISFSGVLTFKNSADLRAIARDAPLDRLLVETDAPFLAPMPHRGKRNEPSFVVNTARTLAEAKGVSFDEIAAATRANTLRDIWQNGGGQGVSLSFTILGCGSSGGVPRVAQAWGACDANEPRNRRRRCSALVERQGPEGRTRVLVDASPDLRCQLLDAEVDHLDAVLLTHPHADHTHGVDDLRPLSIAMRRRLDVHMDEPTAREMRGKFGYIFERPEGSAYPPIARDHRLTAGVGVDLPGPGGAVAAMPFELVHGDIPALGFRFGGLAYTPDLNAVPDAAFDHLAGLDVWVIDALRYAPHPSHLSLAEALALIARMAPKRAVLTNLHTDLDYATLARELPPDVTPAYDGLRIEGF